MKFIAHYACYKPELAKFHPDYWRTIYADDLIEATLIANRYARKNYRRLTLIQSTNESRKYA